MELQPGTILKERYEIIRLLGQGGMGAVYLANDKSLAHEIAIKINQSSGIYGHQQFMGEAHLLAALRHPHLPRVMDYFLLGDIQVLVMDYVPGDDLRKIIEQNNVQSIEQVLAWAKQLGSALEYLHSQNPPVIHRDIKPENIKLSEEGEVMLVDFGIAKASDSTQATATGAKGYTSGYAPPEQYGSGRTGPHSDQYSFAATLYHLLTGMKPVDSVECVVGGAVLAPIGDLDGNIPVHIQEAIHCAMSIRPQDRFSSVSQFAASLEDPTFRKGKHASLGSQSPLTSSDPSVVSISIEELTIPTAPKDPQPESRRNIPMWLIGLGIGLLVLIMGAGGTVFYLLSNRTPRDASVWDPLTADSNVQQTTTAATIAKKTLTYTPTTNVVPGVTPTPMVTHTFAPKITISITETPPYQLVGDGGVVVFVSDREDGETLQLWSMQVGLNVFGELVSTGLEQITFGGEEKQDPAWSPDGKQLLYVAPGEITANGLDIWLMDYSSPERQTQNISNQPGDEMQPVWSPDGSRIAFVHNEDGVLRIISIQPDGSNSTRISSLLETFSEFSPEFSPDALYMLYVTDSRGVHSLVARKMFDAYTTRSPFTSLPKSPFEEVDDPAWSPDGKMVAFTGLSDGETKIYSVAFDTKAMDHNELTKQTSNERQPAWSPDSEYVVFTSERDIGNPEIYIMTMTGLLQKNLSEHPGRDLSPAWQP